MQCLPKTIPLKPLKDGSKLGGVAGSVLFTETIDGWLKKAIEETRRNK
jgi:hypothetical protein